MYANMALKVQPDKISIPEFSINIPDISDQEFHLFKNLIYEKAGITLSLQKKCLVVSRLNKRLRTLGLAGYKNYYDYVHNQTDNKELQVLVDLLTTNETYFFREVKHFDYLKEILDKQESSNNFSVWSAACSTGEETYTIAMVLAEILGIDSKWHILGTDINSDVLRQARQGVYKIEERDKIPVGCMQKYVLKGIRRQQGSVMMDKNLKQHIKFESLNLVATWPQNTNKFDVVFLRNVMIYFDSETKRKLIDKVADRLRLSGTLFVSHSETINNLTSRFEMMKPSIYVKVK